MRLWQALSSGYVSPYEDFTTFTEVDPDSQLSATQNEMSFTGLDRDYTTYAYKDYGAANFDGDFEIWFEFEITAITTESNGANVGLLLLKNDLGGASELSHDQIKVDVFRTGGNVTFRIVEFDNSSFYLDSANISTGTKYYGKLVRDESVGTYGTAYAYLATSLANRESETWAVSLSLALHSSKKDFRYIQVTTSLDNGGAQFVTGSIENLELVSY